VEVTDADLIYNALLRAERRLEEWPDRDPTMRPEQARFGMLVIQSIREEIGSGLAKEGR
jgi:hypothetical protein